MIQAINEMLSYSFLNRALIAGLLISICASLLGVSLVLKKFSMIGDGLSHVGFGSLAVATALGLSPLKFTIPIVIIVSFFILKLNENHKINGDAAIALVSASSLAIGIMAISITTGVNTDINNYLFGSILSMGKEDVFISVILSIVVISLFIFCYHKIFAVTFDEKFAASTGVKTNLYNIVLAVLCSITVVLGMRMMGALLISSLIIFPTLSSMQLFKTFFRVIISACLVSVVCYLIGLTVSYMYATPTGASIVIINLIVLLCFTLIGYVKKHIKK